MLGLLWTDILILVTLYSINLGFIWYLWRYS